MAEQSSVGGLLGAIINPAQVNVLGAVDAGKKRRGKDLAGKILGGTFTGKIGAGMMANLAETDPDQFIKVQNAMKNNLGVADDKGRQAKHMGDVGAASHLIDKGLVDEGMQILRDGADSVDAVLGSTTETKNVRRMLEMYDGGGEGRAKALQGVKALASAYTAQQGKKGSDQRAHESLIAKIADDPNLSEEQVAKLQQKANLIKLRIDAPATGSGALTIAEEGKTAIVAASEGAIAAGKETGVLTARGMLLPNLRDAIKTAEIKATNRGEIFNDLNRMKAGLPGLKQAVKELRELAPLVTSTLGGKVWDTVVKETGFGSTKGGTARAKWIAIINNQVLPLLKPTFGGSFSVAEGAELKATMGDPDKSEDAKMAELDAFVAQKIRDIEGKQLELGASSAPLTPKGLTDNGDGTFTTADGQVLRRKKGA